MHRLGLVLIIVPLLLLGCHYASELILADQCLDAGGSFNYSTLSCSFTEQWEYVPYSVRHRWNLNIARITSYNVCYTKLLRAGVPGRSHKAMLDRFAAKAILQTFLDEHALGNL